MAKAADKTLTRYVAFLLGINVGGNRIVPMAALKTLCERMGYENVRTVLASGNVVFDSGKKTPGALASALETQLKKKFGFEVGVIVHPAAALQKMIKADPFKGIEVTRDTRLYVTFYSGKPKEPVKAQDHAEKGSTYRILKVSEGAVFGVLELGKTRTIDAMGILGKLLGRKITTRNWNTIQKLVD